MFRLISAYYLIAISSVAHGKEELENPSYKDDLIVGGVPVDIITVPYQVALERSGHFFCGGALISLKHVVTAAHCLRRSNMNLKVRMGTSRLLEGGELYDVQNYETHDNYSAKDNADYDVGVITLKAKAILSERVQVIKLTRSEIGPDKIVHVSGWGRFDDEHKIKSPNLQFLFMKTITRSTCKNMIRFHIRKITDRMICAFAENKIPCHGDSGGPLVYKNELVGLVSWKTKCKNSETPGVFTNIGNPKILSFVLAYIE